MSMLAARPNFFLVRVRVRVRVRGRGRVRVIRVRVRVKVMVTELVTAWFTQGESASVRT